MTVSVTLTFPDLQSADAVLHRLAARGEQVVSEQSTKPRGRPPRKDIGMTAVIPESPAEVVPAVPAPTAPSVTPAPVVTQNAENVLITKTEALTRFKALHDAKGLPVCLTVLTRLGAKRFAEVSQAMYPQLVALCDRAIGGEDLTKASE